MTIPGKYLFLLLVGGAIYYWIEVAFRGYSHPVMILVGGICFVLCGLLNNIFSWEMPLWLQMACSAVIITLVEFASGCILNIWLGLHIWDYSDMPFNIAGQICLPYTILWFFLSAAAIILDDYLRYWFFDEEKPRYYLRCRDDKQHVR